MLHTLLQKFLGGPVATASKARPQNRANGERIFCAQPFTRFEVLGGGGERGDVFFCCQNWITKSIGNIMEKSVQDVWNGKAAQDIRRSILDGTFEYCRADLCPYLQRIDGPVQRVKDVKDEIIRKELTIVPFAPSDVICCFGPVMTMDDEYVLVGRLPLGLTGRTSGHSVISKQFKRLAERTSLCLK
jgi:Iron-sulfur cluster-binding domain